MEEIIVGLDIGTTKIACIVGKQNDHGKIEILGMAKTDSIGVQRGVVMNIEKTVQSIKSCVEQASALSGINIRSVYVGIAGQHINSMQHRDSIMRENLEDEISIQDVNQLRNNMFRLVVPAGEKVIDVIPQEFIVDNEIGIKDPVGMFGTRLAADFHIITANVASAKNIDRCVERSEMTVVDMILEPMASAEAVLDEYEKEEGVALVDIGGGTTDIAIFKGGIIRHTAVIPLGGNIITDDIKEGCTIIRNQAEALKVKFGSALAKENSDNEIVSIPGLRGRPAREITLKNLANIIQARVEEIIEQVYLEIKKSKYEGKLIAGIVLTGGGSKLKHIKQLTEFRTGLDTRIGYPSEHLSNEAPKEVASPQFSTGIGLVIKGFNKNEEMKSANEPKSKNKEPRVGKLKDRILGTIQGFFDDENLE